MKKIKYSEHYLILIFLMPIHLYCMVQFDAKEPDLSELDKQLFSVITTPLIDKKNYDDVKNELRNLIKQGAHINARTKEGKTPLALILEKFPGYLPSRRASKRKIKEIIQFIIEHGADVNAIDENKKSVVHLAKQHIFPLVEGILVEAGADPFAKDANGNTVLHLDSDTILFRSRLKQLFTYASYSPMQNNREENKKELKTAMLCLNRNKLPEEIKLKILTFLVSSKFCSVGLLKKIIPTITEDQLPKITDCPFNLVRQAVINLLAETDQKVLTLRKKRIQELANLIIDYRINKGKQLIAVKNYKNKNALQYVQSKSNANCIQHQLLLDIDQFEKQYGEAIQEKVYRDLGLKR